MIYQDVEVERTHSIRYLLNECAKFDAVFSQIDHKDITSFAVEIRYPDQREMPELSAAKFNYQLAEQIKSIVRERIALAPAVKKELNKKELLSDKKKPNGLLPKNNVGSRKKM